MEYKWTSGGKCSECGEPFEGMHLASKTTCGPKCRKKRERRRQLARLAFPLAMYELSKIRDSLKRREDIEKFTEDLKRLKAEIGDLLLLAGEADAVAKREMFESHARKWGQFR